MLTVPVREKHTMGVHMPPEALTNRIVKDQAIFIEALLDAHSICDHVIGREVTLDGSRIFVELDSNSGEAKFSVVVKLKASTTLSPT